MLLKTRASRVGGWKFGAGSKCSEVVVAVANFTPVVRDGYLLGVSTPGRYVEAVNTDAVRYGGSGVHNGELRTAPQGTHGKDHSLTLTLPPLATVILKYV